MFYEWENWYLFFFLTTQFLIQLILPCWDIINNFTFLIFRLALCQSKWEDKNRGGCFGVRKCRIDFKFCISIKNNFALEFLILSLFGSRSRMRFLISIRVEKGRKEAWAQLAFKKRKATHHFSFSIEFSQHHHKGRKKNYRDSWWSFGNFFSEG